jgi:hypothetical protein
MFQDESSHDHTQCEIKHPVTDDIQLKIASEECDMSMFDGVWKNIGETADGRPYYIHRGHEGYDHEDHDESDEIDHFMYFDADCGEYGWDHPMWIIDVNEPNTNATVDLDLDDACVVTGKSQYSVHAVPESGTWHLKCRGIFMKMDVLAKRKTNSNGGIDWVKTAGLDKKGGKIAWISVVSAVLIWAIVIFAVKARRSKYEELPQDLSENLTSNSPTFGENEAFEN